VKTKREFSKESVILCLNAGSSSLKFALFAVSSDGVVTEPLVRGGIDRIGLGDARLHADGTAGRCDEPLPLTGDLADQHRAALAALLSWLEAANDRPIGAVAHRVVHGGTAYAAPIVVDEQSLAYLERLVPLAPLHQPHNLRPIRALLAHQPDWPQVACFDTAFHRTQPWLAQMMPLPRRYWEKGVRRYGFHGLSYEYVTAQLSALLGDRADGRVVIAHLGNGASLCAVHQRQSEATTMGFTAVDGLMMGTRTGAIDAGVLLYLLEEEGMEPKAIERLLYRESGLLGVSEISSDMRTLLASSDPRAEEAIALFCYRAIREVGSLVAVLGGLDALVFTGGIGENAAPIRARIAAGLAWLGVEIDEAANAAVALPAHGMVRIEAPASKVALAVVATDEELMMARHAWGLLRPSAA